MDILGTDIFVRTEEGKGEHHFLLIHNAGSNHLFFTYQIEILKKYGSVTLLDLPGSGKSQPISSYQMEDLAALIEAIYSKLKLKSVILLGLNNGANIALETALRNKIQVEKLILIDPPIFMDSSFISEIQAFIKLIEKGQFDPKFVENLVKELFLETSEENKAIAKAAFNSVDKKSLMHLFQGIIDWDQAKNFDLKTIKCPTLCILTDEHHCSYHKMKSQAPNFEIGKVIGSKCWATLEVPEQINPMIERFIKI